MKKFDLCVVGGAGHVGLPFALVFTQQALNVVIFDINTAALDIIGKGTVPFMESGAEELLNQALTNGRLTLSSEPEVVAQSETIVITIGTPVDEFLNPELKGFRASFESISPFIRDDQLLILRSTLY